MLGQLSDLSLQLAGGQGGAFEPGRRAGVHVMRQEIEAAVDQGAMAGEHDDGQILALALGHVAAGARERFRDFGLDGQSVGAGFGASRTSEWTSA